MLSTFSLYFCENRPGSNDRGRSGGGGGLRVVARFDWEVRKCSKGLAEDSPQIHQEFSLQGDDNFYLISSPLVIG